jgi:hypothetical protein
MLVVKKGHHKDITCYNEIGLCVQMVDTILASIVNITIGRPSLCDHIERRAKSVEI